MSRKWQNSEPNEVIGDVSENSTKLWSVWRDRCPPLQISLIASWGKKEKNHSSSGVPIGVVKEMRIALTEARPYTRCNTQAEKKKSVPRAGVRNQNIQWGTSQCAQRRSICTNAPARTMNTMSARELTYETEFGKKQQHQNLA